MGLGIQWWQEAASLSPNLQESFPSHLSPIPRLSRPTAWSVDLDCPSQSLWLRTLMAEAPGYAALHGSC
jgi:hypothetical protein